MYSVDYPSKTLICKISGTTAALFEACICLHKRHVARLFRLLFSRRSRFKPRVYFQEDARAGISNKCLKNDYTGAIFVPFFRKVIVCLHKFIFHA